MKTFIYKLLAFISIALVLALGMVVVHFSLAKAVITISANQMPVSAEEEIIVSIKTEEKLIASVDANESKEDENLKTVDELGRLRNKILKNAVDDSSLNDSVIDPLQVELKT